VESVWYSIHCLLRFYAFQSKSFFQTSTYLFHFQVAVFNIKANIVWDLGEGYRNEIHYNPFGTILGVCGFGNIAAGKICLYDTEQREEIVALEVPDTIAFEVFMLFVVGSITDF
jgi:uncharacterized protein with WD repeat